MAGDELDTFEIKGNLSVITSVDATEFGYGSIDVDSNINLNGTIGENTLGNGFNIKDLKYTTLVEQTEPSSPSTNEEILYIDGSDSKVKSKDSSGIVTTYQPTTTKGDITVHNGTTQIRVPVGSDWKSLIADSTEASGVKWTYNPFFYSRSIDFFQNDDDDFNIIEDMEITPGIAGSYKVDVNIQFNSELTDITAQGVTDLNAFHSALTGVSTTGTFPAVTTGSTIDPGVYSQAAALAFGGTLTFDGDNDEDSVFILRTNGAVTAAAGTTFNLINDAKAEHIYIVSAGAITLAANVTMSGIYVTSAGAVGTGASSYVTGKLLSKLGAVSNAGTLINSNFDSHSSSYSMGIIDKFSMFSTSGAISNTGSSITGNVGSNLGTITGFGIVGFNGVAFSPGNGASLMTFGIYIDNTVVDTSVRETERESSHFLIKREILLNDIVTVDATQTVSVKVKNFIGISKFYNRIITMIRVG
jgi:hypothetical protein